MDKDNIRMGADGGGILPRMELPPDSGCGCEGGTSGGNGTDTNCPEISAPCVGHEGCAEGSWGLGGYPLAMVYAPCQYFRGLYDPDTALKRGTLFEELDLPLEVARGASCPLGRRD